MKKDMRVLFSALVVFLVACGKSDNTSDLQSFIANLKKQSAAHANAAAFKVNFHKEVSYDGNEVRNPFPQQNTASMGAGGSPLERYPVDALHLVGIVQQDDQPYAVILAPDKKIYAVKQDDNIGSEHARLAEITDNTITVIEPANPAVGALTAKTVILRLKEQ